MNLLFWQMSSKKLHKVLLHTALLCEATPFIQKLALKKDTQNKNIYSNDIYILIVGGIGKINTINSLKDIFASYPNIEKAINIGIAGSSDKNINIGELFCVTNNTKVKNATIKSYEFAVNTQKNINTALVDMEYEHFLSCCSEFNIKNIYSFKVVSDYLENKIPKKEFVTTLIYNNFFKIKEYL